MGVIIIFSLFSLVLFLSCVNVHAVLSYLFVRSLSLACLHSDSFALPTLQPSTVLFFDTDSLSCLFFFKSLVTFTITLVSISLNIYPFRSSFYFLICPSLMARLSTFQASLINYCLLLSFPVFTIALSFVQSLPHPFSRSVFLSFPYHPYSSFVHDQSLPSLLCFALPFLFHYRLSFLQTLAIPSF